MLESSIMPYLFATEDLNYSDYSSGRVIYSQPGAPAFPVRLVSEIFQRARRLLNHNHRLTLYDPTCGGAYHLAALGFLHGADIAAILASDSDEQVLALAQRNLTLLSDEGLARREQEIRGLYGQYGKDSHAEALHSAAILREQIELSAPIHTRAFLANALDRAALQKELSGEQVDLVISDVPYGQLSTWMLPDGALPAPSIPLWQMLDALYSVLTPQAIVAVAADKSQKIIHAGYRRVERFQIGKRQVTLLRPSA